jgi:hypothetical protein
MTRTAARTALTLLLIGVVAAAPSSSVVADGGRPPTSSVALRVVDETGAPMSPATVFACPYVDNAPDCSDLVAAETAHKGVARLRLDRHVRYQFTAFVRDPDPPFACPGFSTDDGELYFSANRIDGRPRDVERRAELVIVRPDPFDCIPITVTDDSGNLLPSAGLIVCPYAADGTPCAAPSFDNADADGVIRLDVDPAVTYNLGAFIAGTGWPCPFVDPSGNTFHFSPTRDVLGADLLGGTTFVIRVPLASECP